jgi:dihydrodipicolinate synthase/N-acetylneuraminate lyase
MPSADILAALRRGLVIPAHPLALTAERKLDERRQRALTRYYVAAGAGGVAVGVHTTQFEIRDPRFGLYQPVLELAAETVDECERASGRLAVRVAGICGKAAQALREAETAAGMGYHAGLLSLGAMKDATTGELIADCRAVAEVIPLFGFYLQPSAGGRILGVDFWRRFAEIPNVVAIKIAPFNRYQTLDVVRAVAEAGRGAEIALYTGNDDSIVNDLLTTFRFMVDGKPVSLRIVGGLLGHWAVWTRRPVELLDEIHAIAESGAPVPQELLTRGAQITDCNAALFDPAHAFAGCIAGIHEVLVRQGLLQGRWCLNPREDLSPGQMQEIDRVIAAYPHLTDDAFVAEHLDEWLG